MSIGKLSKEWPLGLTEQGQMREALSMPSCSVVINYGSVLLRVVAVLCAAVLCMVTVAQAAEDSPVQEGYYTEAQAQRGKLLYNRNCLHCHGGESATIMEWPIGYSVGSRRGGGGRAGLVPLERNTGARNDGRRKYPSVFYLFQRIRDSMPGWGADTVGLQEKADIVAYLLHVNGYSTGPDELTTDVQRMKRMWLVEPGFESLFNGDDFTGWKFVMGINCRLAPEGCAKPDPGTTFRVERGEFVTDGKIQGYAYTEEKFLNLTLRLQFKFVPPPDWEGEQDGVTWWGDNGILLFLGDNHVVWPKGLQFQLMVADVMRPLLMDARGRTTQDLEVLEKGGVLRPLGAWNDVEIVSAAGVITGSVNGVLISTFRDHEFKTAGHIGFQSEGSEVRFRNIRIKRQ